MKKLLLTSFFFFLITYSSNATLITIGTATYQDYEYNLIMDENSPFGSIVWLDYTSDRNTQNAQQNWASTLNDPNTLSYNIFSQYNIKWNSDWRLPYGLDGSIYASDGSIDEGYDGTTTSGYKIISSELGYLYYVSLKNNGTRNVYGDFSYPDPHNSGDFQNLKWLKEDSNYWFNTKYSYTDFDVSWYLNLWYGRQSISYSHYNYNAIAVRSAYFAPIPEPSTIILFGLGLLGLAGVSRKK